MNAIAQPIFFYREVVGPDNGADEVNKGSASIVFRRASYCCGIAPGGFFENVAQVAHEGSQGKAAGPASAPLSGAAHL